MGSIQAPVIGITPPVGDLVSVTVSALAALTGLPGAPVSHPCRTAQAWASQPAVTTGAGRRTCAGPALAGVTVASPRARATRATTKIRTKARDMGGLLSSQIGSQDGQDGPRRTRSSRRERRVAVDVP